MNINMLRKVNLITFVPSSPISTVFFTIDNPFVPIENIYLCAVWKNKSIS